MSSLRRGNNAAPPILMNHVLRIFLAVVFLASGTFGAFAETHGLCDQATATQHHQHQHDVPSNAAGIDADAEASQKTPAAPENGTATADLVAQCHTGGLGCPGCVVPAEHALADPASAKTAYFHAAVFGESADQAGNRRPPRLS